MKIKKIIIPTITMVIIASQLFGCACSRQDETLDMINKGESIEIEVAEPDFEEQGTETQITWTELAKLINYSSYRTAVDNALEVTSDSISKYGVIYVDSEGKQTGNATLYNAFMNKSFVENYWNNEVVQSQLQDGISYVYTDLEESDYTAAIINAYWNLLPDNEPNFFNGGASLTRAEAMTLVMRSTTPVTESGEPDENKDFISAVGESDYTNYASYVADNNYLTTSDKSLNNQTFNGTMTRGEYIYLLIANTFGTDDINNVDGSNTKLNDCKDGTKQLSAQNFGNGDYKISYELAYAIQNPDLGAPTNIYKAVVKANQLGIIGAETRWDEALTRTEAIDLFVDTIQAYANLNGYAVETESGDIDTESIEEKAKAAYNEVKEQLSINEANYVSEYIRLNKDGKSAEEIKSQLLNAYKKEEIKQQEETTQPEVPAEQREKVGSYTEKDLGNSFYQRTWENGAIRYYYYESMFGTYYEVSTPGTIPDWILDDVNSKMDGAGQSTTTTEDSSQQQTQSSNIEEDSSQQQTQPFDIEEESQFDPFSDPNIVPVGGDYDPDAPKAGHIIG